MQNIWFHIVEEQQKWKQTPTIKCQFSNLDALAMNTTPGYKYIELESDIIPTAMPEIERSGNIPQ